MASDGGPDWGAGLRDLGRNLLAVVQQERQRDEEMERREWAWKKMLERDRLYRERSKERFDRQREAEREDRAYERWLDPIIPAGGTEDLSPLVGMPGGGPAQVAPGMPRTVPRIENPVGVPMRYSDLAAAMSQNWLEQQRAAREPEAQQEQERLITVEIGGQPYNLTPREAALLGYEPLAAEDPAEPADPMERLIPPGGTGGKIPVMPAFSAGSALAGMGAPSVNVPGVPNPTEYPQTIGDLAALAIFEAEQEAREQRDRGVQDAMEDRQVTVAGVKHEDDVELEGVRQGNRLTLEGAKQGGREDLARTKAAIDFSPVEALWDNAPHLAQVLMGSPYYSDAQRRIREAGFENPEEAVSSLPYRDLVQRIDALDGYQIAVDEDGSRYIEAVKDRPWPLKDDEERVTLSEALFNAAMGQDSRSVPNASESSGNRIDIDGENFLSKVDGQWRVGNVNRPGVWKIPTQEILDEYVGSR
jgi:hypothetical protein